AKILSMMEDNKQLALRIDGAVQSASQEVTNLRAELTATNRRLAELSGGGGGGPGSGPGAATSASAAAVTVADSAAATMENHQHSAQGSAFGISVERALGSGPIASLLLQKIGLIGLEATDLIRYGQVIAQPAPYVAEETDLELLILLPPLLECVPVFTPAVETESKASVMPAKRPIN
ncbi:hypothetical protein STEG23_010328, partial [Scotinomys teguina]